MKEMFAKQDHMKKIIVLCITAGLLALLFFGDRRPVLHIWHGAQLLDKPVDVSSITMRDITYNRAPTFADLQDKPKLVMIWAEWCKYCAKHLPHFAKFAQEFKQNYEFIPLSTPDTREAKALQFFERYKGEPLRPFLAVDNAFHRALGINHVPVYAIVNSNNELIASLQKPDWNKAGVMNRIIQELLAESSKANSKN